jgi:hypothetical protein
MSALSDSSPWKVVVGLPRGRFKDELEALKHLNVSSFFYEKPPT